MINRRKFIRYAQAGLITTLGATVLPQLSSKAQSSGSVTIEWLGHTCFLFSGSGVRVLTNPFKPAGCTEKYPSPNVSADLVFISSTLLDEGSIAGLSGKPKLLADPGRYQTNGLNIQGIKTLHDRVNGYRFGQNVAWKWNQAGHNIVFLGGIASEIQIEQKILMGQPDILLLPVGGSAKAYNPAEAKAAIETLQPKVVIPMHYRTAAANPESCDLQGLDEFLSVMSGSKITTTGRRSLTFNASNIPASGPVITVMS